MSKAESKRSSVGATPSVSDLQRLQETPKSAKQLVPVSVLSVVLSAHWELSESAKKLSVEEPFRLETI